MITKFFAAYKLLFIFFSYSEARFEAVSVQNFTTDGSTGGAWGPLILGKKRRNHRREKSQQGK